VTAGSETLVNEELRIMTATRIEATNEQLHQLAVDAGCVRKVTQTAGWHRYEATYYVPPTDHWAGWQDADAIRQHGHASFGDLIFNFEQNSDRPWDGTYRHLWLIDG
jgi:hypothetical protein